MPLRHTNQPDLIVDQPWEIRRGLRVDNKRELRSLVYAVMDGLQTCGAASPRNGYTCTRPADHPSWWKHVAADGWEILGVWGGGEPPGNEGDFVDPEDGSPMDDPAVATKADLRLGGVYKLRDRVNKLQVIGGLDEHMPRRDGHIEVLDLTKHEQRAVPIEEIVVVDGLALDMEELGWTIDFAQGLRLKIRDQAVDNYHKGKWCANGLQDGLRDLGLPPYVPQQTGELVIKVPYTALSDASTNDIKKAFEEALGDEVMAALKAVGVDPENDYELELRNGDLKVAVEGVHRR